MIVDVCNLPPIFSGDSGDMASERHDIGLEGVTTRWVHGGDSGDTLVVTVVTLVVTFSKAFYACSQALIEKCHHCTRCHH